MQLQKNSKSASQILATSKELFWRYGVKRVSVEEICQRAGVSKMTFYRNFKNKVDLVSILLSSLTDDGLKSYLELNQTDSPFPEKVKQMILLKQQKAKEVSPEFIRDVFASDNPEWQRLILESRNKMQQAIKEDFLKAKNQGWIRDDLSIEFILYMLDDLQKKANDEHFLALHNGNVEEAIMEMTKFFFYGIIPLSEHQSE